MGEACVQRTCDAAGFILNSPAVTAQLECSRWYGLKVRTGGEMGAVAALRNRGFSPYCPTRKERRRYSDRMKVIEIAAFPGYVFCQFDVNHKLPIISSPGVEYIVGFADGPAPIPEEEIVNIGRMMDAGASPVTCLERGQRVRVTHGPLEGVEGVLIRDSAGARLVVSIELLNQGASLHISGDEVCPA